MAKSNPKNADEGKEMADVDPEAFAAYKDKISQLSAAMTEK